MRRSREKTGSALGKLLPEKASADAGAARGRALRFEPLESRLLLDAGPMISEFLAANSSTLLDGDGDSSDWIEIYNPTAESVNLVGWHLTDDPDDLDQWEFPNAAGVDLTLDPGEYLVVMASGKGDDEQYVNPQGYYVDSSGYLHTSFKLNADAGGDESVALVEPDGATPAHAYWDFLQQYADISFGIAQERIPFLSEGAAVTYHVPGEEVAQWMNPDFDESGWIGTSEDPTIVVAEIGTRKPDYIEIQNVSSDTVDPAGWFVAINDPADGINGVNGETWSLSDEIAPGEVLYRSNEYLYDPTDPVAEARYWGNGINFGTTGPGWAMIVNDRGGIADFVVWGYTAANLATLDFTVGGVTVTYATLTAWQGDPVPRNTRSTYTLQRAVDGDRNNAADWLWEGPGTMGTQNAGLTLPFPGPPKTGIGFSIDPAEFATAIRTDVRPDMHGRNSSILMRIPFEVDDLSNLESLKLEMRYNDGFVAYLNGERIAGRNDPAPLAWNSTATTPRGVAESLAEETIDVTNHLDSLHLGTNLLAVQGLNYTAADDNFLIVPELVAISSEKTEQYFFQPTPGAPNSLAFKGFVGDTKFNVDRGFFNEPFNVEITTRTEGATIRYTTDGSRPTLTNGQAFPGTIRIDGTTTLRAAAFKPGYQPSNVDTQTYIFIDDVIRQTGAGFPNTWGHSGADYAMDPEVIGTFDPLTGEPNGDDNYGGIYAATIRDDLKALPALSLVMNQDDWFAAGGLGIYPQGEGVPKATSAELIHPDGSEGFQIDASVQIQGGSSDRRWNTDKLSMRLKFKTEYGASKLAYPLFGDEAADEFDTLLVDARYASTWTYHGTNDPPSHRRHGQSTRDQYAADVHNALGGTAPHGTRVHLYLNGLYWGIYVLHERPDEHFQAYYLGGSEEDYDVVKHNANTVVSGSNADYLEMFALADSGLAGPAKYEQIQQYLDVPEFIDYMLASYYLGIIDWSYQNWYASRNRVDPDGRWRYHMWDAEKSMWDLTFDRTDQDTGGAPTGMQQRLAQNAEYRMAFADRAQQVLFNDGVLSPENAAALYREHLDDVQSPVVAESARWGDNTVSTPFTRDVDWVAERDRLLEEYFPNRGNVLIGRFKSRGWFPNVDAPAFSQHGGEISAGFLLDITAPAGTIYYTLDGFDPREPGGALSDKAQVYNGAPLLLDGSTLVKARVLSGNTWSALDQAEFLVDGIPLMARPLVITEINYDPYDPTLEELAANPNLVAADFEFIEVQNIGNEPLDLAGYHFTGGVTFDVTGPIQLAAGQRAVIVNNEAAFAERYGDGPTVLGEYDGFLDNNGEHIVMKRQGVYDEVVFDFAYNDGGNWPGKAAGKGASLVLVDAAAVPRSGQLHEEYLENDDNWRSSVEYGGSPGAAGLEATRDVVVNEVLTHTDWPTVDAIELLNTSDQPVDIARWYLSDSWGWASSEDNGNYKKYQIPVLDLGEQGKTLLQPGEYIVFDEDDFNQSGGVDPNDFALNSPHGDDVWLIRADAAGNLTQFADHAEFPAAANGESLGRWPTPNDDFYPMSSVKLGAANSGPRIGPVIISELMYNPPDPDGIGGVDPGDLEFIELFNPTAQAIELAELLDNPQQPGTEYMADWRLRKGVDMEFDPGDTLDAGATLVVLSFNPAKAENAARVTAFREYYGIDASVALAGGYGGSLDNGGERIRLQRPDSPPADQLDFVPHYLEDEIDYDDLAPWPVSADGTGDSLHRLGVSLWGNDSASWTAATPSPGTVELIVAPQVTGRYVFYHNSAFSADAAVAPTPQQLLDGGKDPQWGKQALRPGETATFQNYSTYSLGLNGIVVEIINLPAATTQLTTDDFQFRVGNSSDLETWSDPAATPVPQNIALDTDGAGRARATITWANKAIENQWLQVTVKATPATGLASDDVFYFGNTTGEAGNTFGDADPNALVTYADLIQMRNNIALAAEVTIENGFDFNRDRFVTYADLILCRNNIDLTSGLELIAAPAAATPQAAVDEGMLHDVALDELFDDTKKEGREIALPADLSWLYDWLQFNGSNRPPTNAKGVAEIVGRLLATGT